ncbi:helix-turn-helix domain-containing protein [Actinoplanes sp. CA-051413]|uniref:helix-turn-helix domain-containing protein n=1 Tax=Actinoplanes sp. CA-051413 TaxID=3239899 RepID=UPI003D98E3AB
MRGALLLGVATSVAANILHALPNPISQAIAAWPPLALLLTVELISRIPVQRRSLTAVRLAATATIAAIAAWVSYWHMTGVASRYGEVGAAPYLIPLSVDGLIVVASVCLVELAGRLQPSPDRPDTATDTQADSQPDITPEPTPDAARATPKRPARKRDTGKAVARLRARHPDLPAQEIARRLGVTDRTVRRHLSTTTT